MRRVVFGNGLGRVGICRLSREGQGWRTGLGAGAGAAPLKGSDFSEGLWSPEPWADPAWLPAHGVLLTGLPVTWGAVRAAGGPIQQMRKWRPGRLGFLPDHDPSAPNQASCPGSSLSTLAAAAPRRPSESPDYTSPGLLALDPGSLGGFLYLLHPDSRPWTLLLGIMSVFCWHSLFTAAGAPGHGYWIVHRLVFGNEREQPPG